MTNRLGRALAAATATMAALSVWPIAARAQAGTATAPAAKPDSMRPRVRVRLMGVYDGETGDVVEGADVTDMLTGITARTTKTGTVGLLFADTSGTLLSIKKVGYQATTLAVATGLTDTVPITATIMRAGHVLAPVITVGNRTVRLGPNDTSSVLMKNGFYERREVSGAPRSAFITGDKLRGSTVASNARYFGRAICEGNLFIDGMKMTVPRRTGRFMKEGVDALVNTDDIAGIETYTAAEMPANTSHMTDGPLALDPGGAGAAGNATTNAFGTLAGNGCVTLIWTNR
jgi:hypothetical protein